MSATRWLLGGALLFATVVINPLYACRGGQPASFTFGTDEVRAAIEGSWTLSVPATALAPARSIALRIEVAATPQHSAAGPGLIASAHACASRTLVKSAGACLDVTKVPLSVTVVGGGASAARGALDVFGLSFDNARLDLQVGDEAVSAMLSPAGDATDVRVAAVAGGTLVRTAR